MLLEEIVDNVISEMFRGSDESVLNEGKKKKNDNVKNDTVFSARAKQELRDKLQKYYDNDENALRMQNQAKNIGINLDRGAQRDEYAKRMLDQHGSYEEALRQMSPEIRGAIDAMNQLKDPNLSREEKNAILKKWGGMGGLQRYKDILDKMSLTPTYDQAKAKESGTNFAPYGTNYKVNGENGETLSKKKDGNIVGYDYSELDLSRIPDSEITKYFKSGTRQNHHLDENPNNPTYGEMADAARKGDNEALSVLKNLFLKASFNKVLNSKFGYDFKLPSAMYTYGNAKLPNDTLVINFTTAHRCPAWKDCLVGYACYARGSEHNYEELHKKNSNLHLMWVSSKNDPELLKAMFKVIKMHLINPQKMASALLNNKETSAKWINLLTSGQYQFNKINKKTNDEFQAPTNPVLAMKGDANFTESLSFGSIIEGMGKESVNEEKRPVGAADNLAAYIYDSNLAEILDEKDAAVLKATPNVFRARFIRLNEEGDFIGQWLLDAFDEFAGELKVLGINTAAYTCRNLNFSKIKNIILNASTIKVGTKGENGGVSNAIARRFFAVSKDLYASLEDTYVPSGKKIDYNVQNSTGNGDYDGSKPLVPLHNINGAWHVKYDLKPYTLGDEKNPVQFSDAYDTNGPTTKNRLYYKCPCGRHGDVMENGKPIKMDCYLCRMCYEPKNQQTGEIYVLVEVHGDNIDSFDMDNANQQRGINNTMATYREARQIFNNRLCEHTQWAEKAGLEQIAQNGINSAKNHISQIADSMQQSMRNENKQFNDILNRLNEVKR